MKIPGRPADGAVYQEPHSRVLIDWTPQLVRTAKLMASGGNMRLAADLCSDLLADDDRVKGTLRQRTFGLLGLPINYDPSGDRRQRSAITRALEADFPLMFPEAELAKLMQWGILLGVGLGYLGQWNDGGLGHGDRVMPKLKTWNPRWLRYDWETYSWWVTVDGWREIEIVPGDGRWVLYTPYGENTPWEEGTWRPCALWSLLKTYHKKDWGRQSELSGGIRTADVPENAKKEDRRELAADLADISRDAVIIPPAGYKIRTEQSIANTWQTFKEGIDCANAAIAVANTGQSLSSGTDGGGGSLGTGGASQLHSQVLQSFIDFDANTTSTTLHDQVIELWAELNYGGRAVAPWSTWDTLPPEDKKSKSETRVSAAKSLPAIQQSLRGTGKQVDVIAYWEDLDVPLEPEVVKPAVQIFPSPPLPGSDPTKASGDGAVLPPEKVAVNPPAPPAPAAPAVSAKLDQVVGYDTGDDGTKIMIGYFLPPDLAQAIAIPGGEAVEDLHLTICFLGTLEALGKDYVDKAAALLARYCAAQIPIDGQIGGVGRFSGPPGRPDPFWAAVDLPGLEDFRTGLVEALEQAGLPYQGEHGFTPHITLCYIDATSPMPIDRIEARPMSLNSITLAVGADRYCFPLGMPLAQMIVEYLKPLPAA